MPVLVLAAGVVHKTHGRGTTQVEALPRVSLDINEGDAVASRQERLRQVDPDAPRHSLPRRHHAWRPAPPGRSQSSRSTTTDLVEPHHVLERTS